MSIVDSVVELDSRVNVSKNFTQLVPFTGQNVNMYEIQADGSSYPSQIYFNNIVSPGSLSNTLIGRNARLRYTLTITAPNNAGNPLGLTQNPGGVGPAGLPVTAALRAFPLQSCTDTLSVQLNGATNTVNQRQILSATQRFQYKDYLSKWATEAPCMADNRALLVADSIQTGAVAANLSPIYPVSNQPLSRYENSDGTSRGSFIPVSYTVNGNDNIWVYDISEPLMVSPFVLYSEDVFLANLNNMSLQLNYSSLADMIVSSKAYDIPSGIVISNPRLQLTYISVQPSLTKIPSVSKYDFQSIVYFPQTKSITAGAINTATTMTSNTIRFSAMPQMIYCFVRNPIQNRAGQTSSDCFYSLGLPDGSAGVSIQLGTRSGLLASMSTKTMYQIACSNGYNSTFADYKYGSGSILCINPVKDLGISLGSDSLPGEANGNVNFQVQLNFSAANYAYAGNLAAVPAQVEMMIVAVYSGDMTISPDQCLFNLGTLTQAEVATLVGKGANWVSSQTTKPSVPQGSGLYSRGKLVVGHGQER